MSGRSLPQLLLSYGLRYEYETILRDPNNFGPRFSLAYSPFESGKLVLRFGGGIFFNRPLLRTIDDFTLGKQQLFFDTNLLRDPLTGKLMTAEQRRAFIAANLRFPETLDVGVESGARVWCVEYRLFASPRSAVENSGELSDQRRRRA